ncbi:hypothetical protein NG99_04665 [Erwinia typographi]|uniref:Uncharacterized protein n=1 Tax=Erwinia typographi TaxID=371042 RepID=A0A0A3ZBX9_9GAMM|nr:hypothetical protein [Erwinia typographi]KGT95314.1 hypothetical protein NG99_04665 [Erwinia typographi]
MSRSGKQPDAAVLQALRDIQATLNDIDARLSIIEDAGMKHGTVSGALSGALSGAVVSVGMALVRATAGV